MGFDVENFGLGLLAGWATAYGVYRARHLIGSAAQSVSQQASSAQNYALQNADNRYINDLIQFAETSHIAGRFINLSDIAVEPRFVSPPPLAAPPDDDVMLDVFRVIPHISDYPYLSTPYNVETLSIDDLSTGEHAVALLGRPGSGRTTALLTIALRSLGKIKFDPPIDKVQRQIDAEDAALNEKQRAVRIKERLTIEQRAKERLAEEQGMVFDADADAQSKTNLPLFNRLMPVYIHLADIDVRDPEYGKEVDPAEPLVRAVQRQVRRVTASTIPRNLYSRLSKGQVLLLVDGYDDLPEADRSRQIAWLNALMNEYGTNFFIVVGPATGYGALTKLGLTPVFLRPWADNDIERIADNWANAWPQITRSRRNLGTKPDAASIGRAKTNNRTLPPYELTLKIWANYANDTEIPGFEGWLRAYLGRYLPADQSFGLILPQISQAATLQLDEGYITQVHLEEAVTGQTTSPAQALLKDVEAEIDDDDEATAAKGAKKQETSAQGKLLAMLRRSGLLVRYVGGRYQFKHSFVADYLASLTLEGNSNLLMEKSNQASWERAIAYSVLHNPTDDLVRARLNAPVDVLAQRVLDIARWLPYASADAAWKGNYLKYLGNMLIAPSQYPLLRERAAAALIETRERNVLFIFRQAARNANADLRRLACLGMGAVGDPEAINDLIPLLKDQNADVQISAAMALGAIRTEEALTALVEAFTEGSEQLRRVVAETFADIPSEGYPVLYDAIQDEEMMLRRAAVFGLRRVKSPWALIAIYRAFLEDEQWYVRSAAQIAFLEQQYGQDHGPKSYPPTDRITWLNDWASNRGENVPPGEGANQMLIKALQEGDTNVRVYAAIASGQLGLATSTKPLYGSLRDRQPEVREAAHRALGDLQMQMGESLPSPI
jgi:HEAT repeat protein